MSALFSRYSALAISMLGRQSLGTARRNVELAYDTSNILFQVCFRLSDTTSRLSES